VNDKCVIILAASHMIAEDQVYL